LEHRETDRVSSARPAVVCRGVPHTAHRDAHPGAAYASCVLRDSTRALCVHTPARRVAPACPDLSFARGVVEATAVPAPGEAETPAGLHRRGTGRTLGVGDACPGGVCSAPYRHASLVP
jgi:hypothetical protein